MKKKPHCMTEEEMDALAYRLAWPGIARNEEEIDKVLGTLPEHQAIELREWIELAREEFEEDFEQYHAEMYAHQADLQTQMKADAEGKKETARLCQIIKFPLGDFGGDA
jgi:hypothetical protein